MTTISNALLNLRQMDELASGTTAVHRIHPLAKVLVTLGFLMVVVSFDKYQIAGLLGLFLYPFTILGLAQLPVKVMLKRMLVMEPIIIGIAALSPFFDHNTVTIGDMTLSAGWVVFLSILIKGTLTILAGLLLIATTGIDKVAESLRMLRVPRILVLQLLLTYRYILVLIEEVSRMNRAYFLRAPAAKGIHFRAWGSFAGQLLLRTFDRAQRIYIAMSLRGFQGEYHNGHHSSLHPLDFGYFIGWMGYFILNRWIPISDLVTLALKGVFGI